jgi:hypothetical protein
LFEKFKIMRPISKRVYVKVLAGPKYLLAPDSLISLRECPLMARRRPLQTLPLCQLVEAKRTGCAQSELFRF